MATFSENLKFERQKKNLSQQELGERIGVTGVTIMRYEKGLREPKLETVTALANALKIPVANLIDINSPIMNKATNVYARAIKGTTTSAHLLILFNPPISTMPMIIAQTTPMIHG